MENTTIPFARKDYQIVRSLGTGALGDVRLLKDETIDELFACKKYSPSPLVDSNGYFDYFIKEIKLLYSLYHKNIVRVFNYYMYPQHNTGYIIMEYIKGVRIDEYVAANPNSINSLFEQIVDAFVHIHKIGILHRDIKPSNILITEEGILKVIDFGLSKWSDVNENDNSLSVAGMYDRPTDYKEYSYSTEVYFVGQLFRGLITDFQIQHFIYNNVLEKMCSKNPETRISDFFSIYRLITDIKAVNNKFSTKQRSVYRNFADSLLDIISMFKGGTEYERNSEIVQQNLESCYQMSLLEEVVQCESKIISAFVTGGFKYYQHNRFNVSTLKEFISFFKLVSEEQKQIVLNNLWSRFDKVEREYDDLPF